MKTVLLALPLGVGVLIAVVVPWSVLAGLNLRLSPRLPWSIPIIAIYLAGLLCYLNGHGWPKSTAAARQRLLRLRWLSGEEWTWALLAGTLGVLALWAVYAAVGGLSGAPPAKIPNLPLWTLLLAVCTSAAVTAIGEEAGFRGYMQAMLETRFKLVVTTVLVSVAFTLLHLTHGAEEFARNGAFYFAASCIYCLLAYCTQSILPSLFLHFAGDVFLFALRSSVIQVAVPNNSVGKAVCVGSAIVMALASAEAFRRLTSQNRSQAQAL